MAVGSAVVALMGFHGDIFVLHGQCQGFGYTVYYRLIIGAEVDLPKSQTLVQNGCHMH